VNADISTLAGKFGPSIRQFEALEIDPASFDHEAHVYVAWQYLADSELLEAIGRYRRALRRLTVKLGIPGKYHETITWFYMIAVAERRQARPGDDWPSFKTSNADLFEPAGAFLRRYYSAGTIDSPVARKLFILPDRQGSTSSV
jgi:hypothetical protein